MVICMVSTFILLALTLSFLRMLILKLLVPLLMIVPVQVMLLPLILILLLIPKLISCCAGAGFKASAVAGVDAKAQHVRHRGKARRMMRDDLGFLFFAQKFATCGK